MEEYMKKLNVTVNGKTYEVEVMEEDFLEPQKNPNVVYAPASSQAEPQVNQVAASPAPAPAAPAAASASSVTSPLPGTINKVNVSEGASVSKGDVLLVLEAMKMENDIKAPNDGVVNKIHVASGDSVNTGDPLVDLA